MAPRRQCRWLPAARAYQPGQVRNSISVDAARGWRSSGSRSPLTIPLPVYRILRAAAPEAGPAAPALPAMPAMPKMPKMFHRRRLLATFMGAKKTSSDKVKATAPTDAPIEIDPGFATAPIGPFDKPVAEWPKPGERGLGPEGVAELATMPTKFPNDSAQAPCCPCPEFDGSGSGSSAH